MRIVKDGIKSLNAKVLSIVLYGGYGRNEGSWIIEDNDTVRPYNDYDILLVLREKIYQKRIDYLRKEIARKIGIRWVDIGQSTPDELRTFRPSIYSYDLKHAGKVIEGDESVLNNIPDMKSSELSLREGEILFFTRLWTLLGSLDVKGLKVERNGEESRFFRNQMAKAILAVVDILLLQKNAYHPSYVERNKRLAELYFEKTDFHQLSRWALEEKLFPKAPVMTAEEVKSLYCKVHSYFFTEMFKVLAKYYVRPVNSIDDVESHLSLSFLWFLRKLARHIIIVGFQKSRSELSKLTSRLRNQFFTSNTIFKRDRVMAINLAQAFIATAYENGIINRYLLYKGNKWMRCVDKDVSLKLSWDEARVKVARMRMEV